MDQNSFYGAAPMMGGYQYSGMPAQQPTKTPNYLSADEIKELQQTSSQFSLGLTDREVKQAYCNHRTADGLRDSLVFDEKTGLCRCTICGYEFRPVDMDTNYETIKESCDRVVDFLQTIKIMYTELPAQAAKDYFPIIPLINKIPQLFEFAAKCFAKHEYNGWNYMNNSMGGAAMFANLSSMFGGGMPQMQQPAFGGAPMGAPGFMNQPVQAPYGAPVAAPYGAVPNPAANAFGFVGASTPGYNPMTQGYQYVPGQAPAAPAQPTVAAPAAPAEAAPTETVTKTVNV